MSKSKLFSLLLTATLVLPLTYTQVSSVKATNFSGKESKYYKLCSSSTLSSGDKKTCKEFNSYLKDQSSNLKDQIADAKKAIEDTQKSVDDIVKSLDSINAQIADNTNKINYVSTAITNTQNEIDTKKEELKARLYSVQSQLNTNMYADYLLGASSFGEFFSRAATLGDLTSYENDLVNEIHAKEEELKAEQATLNSAKEALAVQKQAATKQQAELVAKVTGQKAALDATQQQLNQNTDSIEVIAKNMADIEKADKLAEVKGVTQAVEDHPAQQQQPAQQPASKPAQSNTTSNSNSNSNKNTNTNNQSSSNNATAPAPTPTPSHPATSGNQSKGMAIANTALSKQGSNYVWGASGPNTFDCSGLVWWAHKQNGVNFGRCSTKVLVGMGQSVARGNLQAGDIILFSSNGKASGVHHVGIYVGGGRMVHAPRTGETVKVVNITSGYYNNQYYTARRLY